MVVRFHEDLIPLMKPLDLVRPHPENPNNGDTDAIIESIEVNGFTASIIAQRSTGYIIDGNHRYAALMEMGATEAPIAFVDMEDDAAVRYMIAANQIARLARTDPQLELELLQRLLASDEGLAGTGHSDLTMQDLMLMQQRDEEQSFFAGAFDTTPSVFQVIVEFKSESEAEDLEAELADRELDVRRVNL